MTGQKRKFQALEHTFALGSPQLEIFNSKSGEEQARIQIQQEKREQKATKSDDASIPVHLWTEQFIKDYPVEYKLQVAVDDPKIEAALEVLRHS